MFGEEVFCAGDDGSARVWRWEGRGEGEGGELKTEMAGEMKINKVIMGEWNPIAEGIVGVLGIDLGKGVFIVWDYKKMQTKRIDLAYTVPPEINLPPHPLCLHNLSSPVEYPCNEFRISRD